MPDMIQHKEWHCAESVELNHWTFEVQSLNPAATWGSDDITICALLCSVASICHNAVHRHQVAWRRLTSILWMR